VPRRTSPWVVYLVGGLLLAIVFGAMSAVISDNANEGLHDYQMISCKTGVKERVGDVRVYASLIDYYHGVLVAQSVKQDVKSQAEVVRDRLIVAAHGKRDRVWQCGPRVNDAKNIPDRRLIATLPSLPPLPKQP
jgi:hypothetical protein